MRLIPALLLSFYINLSFAQIPTISVAGLPAEMLIGEQYCSQVSFTNTHATPGYGPYFFVTMPPLVDVTDARFVDIPPTIQNIGAIDGSGQIVDPISGAVVSGEPGGTGWLVRYPVGSVVQGQAALNMDFCLSFQVGATINQPLPIEILPGFEFGDTATGDNGPVTGTPINSTVTPIIARVNKENTAPENERPPGPSNPFSYTYTMDISDAALVTDIQLTDILPPQIQWTGTPVTVNAPTGVNCQAVAPAPNLPPLPGGTMTVTCDSVTGTSATADLTVSLPVYISDILDETIPDSQVITNTLKVDYKYEGLDHSDTADSQVLAVHAAVQKRVDNANPLPGDTLQYTIDFQTTDYPSGLLQGATAFNLEDVVPDGMTFVSTDALIINGNPHAISESQQPGPAPGTTQVNWDISAAVGRLRTGAQGTLKYSVRVDTQYADGSPVSAGDVLSNHINLDYDLHAGGSGNNDSTAPAEIVENTPEKTIQAPDPLPAEFAAGDSLTFRLSMQVPAGSSKNVQFVDQLPLPVVFVSDIDLINDITVISGPTPAVTTDVAANSITFDWGDITSPTPVTLTVDIQATITAEPFADNLFLTNVMTSGYENSDGDHIDGGSNAAGFNVGAPVLNITKGVFAIDNANAQIQPPPPVSAISDYVTGDVTGADAADLVEFVINVENVGGQNAYNVVISDPGVAGLTCNATPIAVTDGTGSALTYTGNITTGIHLDNPLAPNNGLGAPFGADTAIVHLYCQVAGDVFPSQKIINKAAVSWTSTPAGSSSQPPRKEAEAFVQIARPVVNKEIIDIQPGYSSQNHHAHIGELVTYRVTVHVPEGQSPQVLFNDLLDEGLAFVQFQSITPTAGITTDVPGGFGAVLSNSTFSPEGSGLSAPDRRLNSDFGTITNTDTDNLHDDTISLVYVTRVINWSGNLNTDQRQNLAKWSWLKPNAQRPEASARAARLTLVEPQLKITKQFSPDHGDLNTISTVSVRLQHAGDSTADAFDIQLSDLVPTANGNIIGNATVVAGNCNLAPDSLQVSQGVLEDEMSATWSSFPLGSDCTIEFDMQFTTIPAAGDIYTNCARGIWESLSDNDQPLATPPNNILGAERTGLFTDTGGSANTYATEDCDDFNVNNVSANKFTQSTSQPHTDGISTQPGHEPLTIGEEITFRLTVTVPASNADQLLVVDTLPHDQVILEALDWQVVQLGSDLVIPAGKPTVTLSDNYLSDSINDTLSFDFGDVVNAGGDGISPGSQIWLEVRARVKDLGINVNNKMDDNVVVVSWGSPDSGLKGTARQGVELVEPLLSISKSADRSEMEAGDTATYTLHVSHLSDSRSDAFSVSLQDILPADLSLVPGSVVLGSCTQLPTTGPSEGSNELSAFWAVFPLGKQCDILFQAKVDITASAGEIIRNDASLAWHSLDPNYPPTAPDNDDRDYSGLSHWDITISKPGLSKHIIDTDIPETDLVPGSNYTGLTIGEQVTFEIIADFQDGTTHVVSVFDRLPANGVRLKQLSSRITHIGADLSVTGAAVGDAGDACLPNCSGNPDGIRDMAQWNLGDIINQPDSRPAGDAEDQIRFEVVAIVLDNPQNSGMPGADNDLRNKARMTSSDFSDPLYASTKFGLLEPLLEMKKTLTSGARVGYTSPGKTQRFKLVVKHRAGSTAAALNTRVMDILPSETTWAGNVSTDCPSLSTDTSALPTVTFDIGTLSRIQGQCSIEYDVQSMAGLPVPGIFVNQAELDWESAPGSSESRMGNRTGQAALVSFTQGAVNKNYFSSSVSETSGSSEVTIGERVTYYVKAVIAEGTTRNVVLTDRAQSDAAGVLEILDAQVINLGNNLSSTQAGTAVLSDASGNGWNDTARFDFGDVTNSGNDAVYDGDDTVTIQVTARVIDVPANVDGTVLTNEAELDFTGSTGPHVSIDRIQLVEPGLKLEKQFESLVDGVASIHLIATNTGTAPDFDVQITDVFDESLWMAGSFTAIDVPPGFEVVDNSANGLTTVSMRLKGNPYLPAPDQVLMPGESLELRFSMKLMATGQAPDPSTIPNTAIATADSLPGTGAPHQRQVSTNGSDNLSLPLLDVLKAWSEPSGHNPVLPDDLVTYTLTIINNGASEATHVVLTDIPDPIGEFLADVAITSGSGTVVKGNVPGDTDIEVHFPSIGAGDSVVMSYHVRIPNPYPARTAEQLLNQAIVDTDQFTAIVSDDPATSTEDDPTVVPILADPIMQITKGDHYAIAAPGQVLRYYLNYGNKGNQNAMGVVIQDHVPAYTTFDAGNSSPGWSCTDGAAAGTLCEYTVGGLIGGQGGQAIFALNVDASLPAGVDTIENTAFISEDGSSSGGVQSTDTDSDKTPLLFAEPRLEIAKDDGGVSIQPGQSWAYTLTYENSGAQNATGVVLTDVVPDYTQFNASLSTPGWSCNDGDPAGTVCTYLQGDLPVGIVYTVEFGLTLKSVVPSSVSSVHNDILIEDDGNNSVLKQRATASDDTPLLLGMDLQLHKSDGGVSATPGRKLVYTLNYSNVGIADASGVVIEETVPDHTHFSASDSQPNIWSCPDNSPAGTACTLAIGNLPAGASGSVTFAVIVDWNAFDLTNTLFNQAHITDDGADGPDLYPQDNFSDETTPVVAAPAPAAIPAVGRLNILLLMLGILYLSLIALMNNPTRKKR
ncbi:DUF11 domain-containing protein [Thiolapillus brandeum]|uniref:DUF11 domain-containing protein n=1 Tax=Thiolapillus brandeum TaxID=1076588 RepID=A0A7U6JI26_9GAMM|nr:DUF11 domain-containing protein [Thiolapillus brandeum]BAO44886.1 hypothetical protein TBH_C1971 [Thiolapillus brandeum]